jgi:L-ascorbate metabolism protein UlaG (beta-lactamase superfamily)
MRVTHKDLDIQKLEHDTVLITSSTLGVTIAIDPFQSSGILRTDLKADIIFFTHDHFDHFSPKDVQPLATRSTIFVFPSSILDKIQTFLDVDPARLVPVVPLEEYKVTCGKATLSAMAVPAYNLDKRSPQGNLYHAKDREYVGYLLEIGGTGVYFVGDSDPIPEMDALVGMVEVLLLPISGVYVMTMNEAVDVTQKLHPNLVIPMHYGSVVGEASMGEQFRQLLTEVAPEITVAL